MVEGESTTAAAQTASRLAAGARKLLPPASPLTWAAAISLLLVLVLWLWLTPGGLLGKADAVGYAVCHRITVRSFLFPNGRQLPMCARCSGTFIGVLVGLFGPGLILRRSRAAEFPPMGVVLVMLGFSAWWALDGANSFRHLLPAELPIPYLFEPNNIFRVTTGMLHGITMGGLVLPVINASLWADARSESTLRSVWDLLALYGIAAVLILMLLSGWPIFLYPLAVASAAGAVTILTGVTTVMAATLLRRENQALTVGDMLPMIFIGLALTLLLIGAIDLLRYAFFGSWDGLDISMFRQ